MGKEDAEMLCKHDHAPKPKDTDMPAGSKPVPAILRGSWLNSNTLFVMGRVVTDDKWTSSMEWNLDLGIKTQAMWLEDDGALRTRYGIKKKIIKGTVEQDNTRLVWNNGQVWRRAPTVAVPDEWIVVDKGGVIVRDKEDIKSKKLGVLPQGQSVTVVQVSGSRARLIQPFQGWISTECDVLIEHFQLVVPSDSDQLAERLGTAPKAKKKGGFGCFGRKKKNEDDVPLSPQGEAAEANQA